MTVKKITREEVAAVPVNLNTPPVAPPQPAGMPRGMPLNEEYRGYFYVEKLDVPYVIRMPVNLTVLGDGSHAVVDNMGVVHIVQAGWKTVQIKNLPMPPPQAPPA